MVEPQDINGRNRAHLILLAATVFCMWLWGCTIMLEPLRDDTTLILVVAKLIGEGHVMYRDVWNQNYPGNFLLYLFSLKVFGDTPRSIYWLNIIWRIATLFSFYLLVASIECRRVALVAAAILACVLTVYWALGLKEFFMLLFLVLAMYYFLKWRTSAGFYHGLAIGALLGLGTLMKPVALSTYGYLILVLAIDCLMSDDKSFRRIIKPSLGMSLGIAIPWVPLLLHLYLAGGLMDMWNHIVVFNVFFGRFTDELSLLQVLSVLEKMFYLFQLRYAPAYFATMIGILCVINDRNIRRYWIIIGWIPVVLLGILVQRKFLPHHFTVLLAPGIPLMAYGADSIVKALVHAGRESIRPLAILALGLVALVGFEFSLLPHAAAIAIVVAACFGLRLMWPGHPSLTESRAAALLVVLLLSLTTYWRLSPSYAHSWAGIKGAFGKPQEDNLYFPASVEICDYIKSRVPPDERILVWGWDASIYYLSDRKAPTAFLYDLPLIFRLPGTEDPAYFSNYKKKNKERFMEDIMAEPPSLIVVETIDRTELETFTSKEQLNFFPEFKAFLAANYRLDRTINTKEIYIPTASQ
jgi:4-amino-4-deoxy-L-arabinose transferase-like glycosyltransferase